MLHYLIIFSLLLFLRPYYETRANNIGTLNDHKDKIISLESKVSEAKMSYNETLRCLELISEEIHKMRQDKYNLLKNHEDNYYKNSTSNNRIDLSGEYLDFPKNILSPNESDSETFHRSQGYSQIDNTKDNDNTSEKWTEIILSSESPNSNNDNKLLENTDDDDDEDEQNDNNELCNNTNKKYPESLTNWITKSNLKNKERRQSLDILYDASDKVKDVFTQGFQKVGRTLERRNSESEASLEFFLFNRSENLSDNQIENLQLNRSISSIYDDFLKLVK